MKIYYDEGRCGDGKTYAALKKMAAEPAKYILAVDKLALVADRKATIAKLSAEVGTRPIITAINSENSEDEATLKRVEAIAESPFSHQVVIITHKALQDARFGSQFSDWHMVIDEDFNTLEVHEWNLTVSQAMTNEVFKFVPVADNVFKIEPAQDLNEVRFDNVVDADFKHLRHLVTRHDAFTNRAEAGARFCWWSVWDFYRLANFKSVTMLANAFSEKMSFKLASMAGVEFEPVKRAGGREWSSRPVTIRYFSNKAGSSTFFASDQGPKALKAVAEWQVANHTGSEFWSSNTGLTTALSLAGTHIRPLAAGRNDLMDYTTATFIYSAKSNPIEAKALRNVSNNTLDGSQIMRDREYEAIGQFILRGSLRQPEDQRPVEIRLFSKDQAEFAAAFLTRHGYVSENDISLELIDLNFERTTKKAGRPKLALTEAEKAERAVAKREYERQKKAKQRERLKAA